MIAGLIVSRSPSLSLGCSACLGYLTSWRYCSALIISAVQIHTPVCMLFLFPVSKSLVFSRLKKSKPERAHGRWAVRSAVVGVPTVFAPPGLVIRAHLEDAACREQYLPSSSLELPCRGRAPSNQHLPAQRYRSSQRESPGSQARESIVGWLEFAQSFGNDCPKWP